MLIRSAPDLLPHLRGVLCVHKPADITVGNIREKIITKMCQDLNEMEVRPPEEFVQISPCENSEKFEVIVRDNLADHPLVVGPRYIPEDFKVSWSNYLGRCTSGVLLFGIREGTKWAKIIRENQPTRAYKIKGRLGRATKTFYKDGVVVEKSTYKHVQKIQMEQLLSHMQAAHQRKMFENCGVDIQSQTAYELASTGLIRPMSSKIPVVYSIKCVEFDRPYFTIEIQCVNEYEKYLMAIIHEIGMKLNSTAHCTAIKCIRHSYFTLDDALLKRQWNLQNIVQNIENNNRILASHENILRQESVTLTN